MCLLYFKYDRGLLTRLCHCAYKSPLQFLRNTIGLTDGRPGVVLSIHSFGDYPEKFHPHIHAIVSDGLFAKTGTFYVMPGVELRPLEEIFRASVFEMLKEEGGYKTKTILRMTQTKENSHRMPKIIAFWEEIITPVLTTPEHFIPPPSLFQNNMFSSGKPLRCKRVGRHFSIRSDGTVILCCRDWGNVYSMGNLVKENVLDIYNGKKFREIRTAIKTGVNYPTLCKYCKADSTR